MHIIGVVLIVAADALFALFLPLYDHPLSTDTIVFHLFLVTVVTGLSLVPIGVLILRTPRNLQWGE